jgi:hypothetical protein
VELIDDTRVELLVNVMYNTGYLVSVKSVSGIVSVSLPSLSLVTERFMGDERFGYHNDGGSTFSETIPKLDSSLECLVGLRPRRGVVWPPSLAAKPFKSSIIVKSPSRTPSASRFPATII